MVELSGTRTAPLATPSIAGPSRRAATLGRSQQAHDPARPVDLHQSAVGDPRVASPVPTTAGRANSRATTAACDRTPPVSVISPPAIAKSGTHDGFDDGQTMMSPGWTAPKSSGVSVSRARATDDAGRRPGPAQLVRLGRGEARAVEPVADRRRRRRGFPTTSRRSDGRPVRRARRDAPRRPRADRSGPGAESGTSARWRYRTSSGRSMTPVAARRRPTRITKRRMDDWALPVDPVVVDLGQGPICRGRGEERLEPLELAPGRRRAARRTPRPRARRPARPAARAAASASTSGGCSSRFASSVRS